MSRRLGEQAGERRDILRRGFRKHTMPKVENVGSRAKHPAKFRHRVFESGTSCNQQHGIKIPLNCRERL
jgi:hypothetical protein